MTVINNPPGALVRYYRTQRGIPLTTIAGQVGMSASYLSMIENGSRNPVSYQTWERLAYALGINPSDLLGGGGNGDGQQPPPPTDLEDEEAILKGAWDLFYRAGSVSAAPLVQGAIRRLSSVQARPGPRLTLLGRFYQLQAVLYRDEERITQARQAIGQALNIARSMQDSERLGAALMRAARIERQAENLSRAVDYAQEAHHLASRCRYPLRGYLAQNLADLQSSLEYQQRSSPSRDALTRLLEQSRRALAMATPGEDDGSFTQLSKAGIDHDEALIQIRQGYALSDVLTTIQSATKALPSDSTRWRLTFGATEVLAYAVQGDIDAATVLTSELLPAVRISGSSLKRLHTAHQLLVQKAPTHPAVRRMGQQLAG